MRHLTPREMMYVKHYVRRVKRGETGCQTAAYQDAAPATAKLTATARASEMMSREHVRQAIKEEFERQDVNERLIVGTVKDAFFAEKETSKTGRIVPDHAMRLKAAEVAAKFMDIAPVAAEKKGAGSGDAKHLHLHFEGEPVEVTRFVVMHGRYPNDAERKELLGEKA